MTKFFLVFLCAFVLFVSPAFAAKQENKNSEEKINNTQEVLEEIEDITQPFLKQNKKQNAIRETVQNLLDIEDRIGGIGQQVSAIAREFNNSIEKTIQAEEKIQKRSKFIKFFIGGVKSAAQELKQEAKQNKEKIQELKKLKEQNWMQTEIKEMFQEQIQNMEQEQSRLEKLANKEINKKGILNWLINLFK